MASTTPRVRKPRTKKTEGDQLPKALVLAGELLNWNLRSNRGVKNKHTEVLAALKEVSLDEKEAKELEVKSAFSRACDRLAEERVIDLLKNASTKDEIVFQFSKQFSTADTEDGGQQVGYEKEVRVSVDRTTGKVSCKRDAVREQAQAALDRAMEERTTSDVTGIVERLFRGYEKTNPSGGLVPFGVGVYFVPAEHSPFLDRMQAFLGRLNRRVLRLPVPAGTSNGDAAVQQNLVEYLDGMVEQLNKDVEGFSLHTRADTISNAAERINTTRLKVEAYAGYLKEQSEKLLGDVEAANSRLIAQVEKITEEKKNAPPKVAGEGTDAWGTRLGTKRALINAQFNASPQTMKEITKAAGFGDTSSFGPHFQELLVAKHIIKVGDKYALAPATAPTEGG